MEPAEPNLDLIRAAHDGIIDQADLWVSMFEQWWRLSRNPVFAWLALRVALAPSRPPQALPEWLRAYLCEAATNLTSTFAFTDPIHAPKMIPQALGLSKEGKSIVDDARLLIDAPVVYGLYEHFKKTAPPK